ncbi:MAG: glycosyltransferase family 2 protein [Planctomycetota bacterium]
MMPTKLHPLRARRTRLAAGNYFAGSGSIAGTGVAATAAGPPVATHAAHAAVDSVSAGIPGASAPASDISDSIDPAAEVLGELELSVVMPCLNEERTLPICIRKARDTMEQLGIRAEVLIVDNGSTDRSVEVARECGARVIHQPLRGYGNALRLGFEEARGRYIIMADCDDSYDLTDLGRFVERLRGGAELVMGNRLKGEIKPGAMPWHHRWIGNPGLSWFLNVLFNTGVGDSHCGMRGFTKEAFLRMSLQMPGMEMASEMVIKSARAKLRIEEIPITLHPDGRDRKPHLRSFRDGWRHLRFMLMCSPRFLFVIPGLLLTLLGLGAIPSAVLAGYGVFTDVWGPNFMYTASILSILGSHLVVFGFLAKLYAHQVDPVFEDPRVDWALSFFKVERGLILGLALIFASLLIGVPVLWHWWLTGGIVTPARWIFAGTLFTLGTEAIFASFLVGILDLPREVSRGG